VGRLPICAAILAGGFGTRLRQTVPDRPKALAPVAGQSYLTHLLDQLQGFGIRDVVLCTGYLGDQVKEAIGERYGDLRIEHSREREPLGTAGALRLAQSRFRSDPVLVMNGDSYCDEDFAEFLAWHRCRGAAASLIVAQVQDVSRFGRVQVSADGYVRRFEEKGGGSGPGWINAGIYLLGKEFLSRIPCIAPLSLEMDLFPAWIDRGLHGFRSLARFIDIGTKESYAEADRFFGRETRAETFG
jgi:NDP-sugar pyrophosphorylase family protein